MWLWPVRATATEAASATKSLSWQQLRYQCDLSLADIGTRLIRVEPTLYSPSHHVNVKMRSLSDLGVAVSATLNIVSGSGLSEQVPLGRLVVESGTTSPSWELDFSSTAPYLFSSVSSLLQQWGNTFFPNGHNIVPCEIPPYTLFYHGRLDDEKPPSPEWVAFDL
jgi:hypothetical protein